MTEMSELRKRMRSGEQVIGTFLQIGDPTIVEVLGRVGFDFAIVDFEHGGTSRAALPSLLRAGDAVGLPLLARVTPEELSRCSQMLDLGVRGLLVPRVTTVEQAEHAVSVARYRPLGERGACPGIRASDYGSLDWPEHQERAEERTIVGVGLEGAEGLQSASAIASLPGIDFLFVGVFDLAHTLGHSGEVEDPDVISALSGIVSQARAADVAVGTWAPNLDVARRWRDLGVTVSTVSTDVLLWRRVCTELIADWRASATLVSTG